MTRIVPLHSNLVVDPHPLGDVSKGGILIPHIGKASTPYRYATVLEVGPGRYAADGTLIPCTCKPGDVVAYSKNQGVEFPLEDENGDEKTVLLINEQFVIGVAKDLPQKSMLSGLDGRLLMMAPGSRAISDGALANLEDVARAKATGFLDSSGTMIEDMEAADRAEAEAD